MKRRFALVAIVAIALLQIFGFSGIVTADELPDTINAIDAQYYSAYTNSQSMTYEFENVVDYKGVEGDSGVLVKMIPNTKGLQGQATGYIYLDLPVNINDVSLEIKYLTPSKSFWTYVDWIGVGFMKNHGQTFFENPENVGPIFLSQWALNMKVPANGNMVGGNSAPFSLETGYGMWDINEAGYPGNTYTVKKYDNEDKFEMHMSIVPWAPEDGNPQNTDLYGVDNPLQIRPSDFEEGRAYLTIGCFFANTSIEENLEFIIKDIKVPASYPESVTIGGAASREVNIGASFTLNTTVLPSYAVDKSLIWASSNEEVCTVDENGLITSVGAGTTTITATTINGKSAGVEITVKKAVSEIVLNKNNVELKVGETVKIKATVLPEGVNQSVVFSSDDESIATIDQEGNIKGVKAGTLTITATSSEDNSISATLTVKVIEANSSNLTWILIGIAGVVVVAGVIVGVMIIKKRH